MIAKLAAIIADSAVPSELVETITSTKGLGSVAGVVIVVLGYLFLTRRTPNRDLAEHEQTKRVLIEALGGVVRDARKQERSGGSDSKPAGGA